MKNTYKKEIRNIGKLKKFLRFFFYVGHFLKYFIEFVSDCFCFVFWFSDHETCGIFAPWPEIEPKLPA